MPSRERFIPLDPDSEAVFRVTTNTLILVRCTRIGSKKTGSTTIEFALRPNTTLVDLSYKTLLNAIDDHLLIHICSQTMDTSRFNAFQITRINYGLRAVWGIGDVANVNAFSRSIWSKYVGNFVGTQTSETLSHPYAGDYTTVGLQVYLRGTNKPKRLLIPEHRWPENCQQTGSQDMYILMTNIENGLEVLKNTKWDFYFAIGDVYRPVVGVREEGVRFTASRKKNHNNNVNHDNNNTK